MQLQQERELDLGSRAQPCSLLVQGCARCLSGDSVLGPSATTQGVLKATEAKKWTCLCRSWS